MKAFSILFAFFFAISSLTAGGGWPQPKGKGFFKFSESFLRASQFFSPDGSTIDITTTSIYTTSFYGEYGISNRLTATIYAPLFIRSTINNLRSTVNDVEVPGDSFNGFGDLNLGIKYGILTKGPIALSASVTFGLPTGNNVGGNSELLQTGDGEFNQLFQLEASHSFYPAKFYATLSVGFNNRTTATFAYSLGEEEVEYSDEFHWGGEIGWTPSNKWVIALKWAQVVSLKNGNSGGNTGNSSLFGNNVEYFSVTPEISYSLNDKWGFSVSAGGAVSGKNILAAPVISGGVFFKL